MTKGEIRDRIFRRLGEDPTNPQWWTKAEADAAINWSTRLFVLLTLCLESRRSFTLTPGNQFVHLLQEPGFGDFLLPLRIRLSNDQLPHVSSEPNSGLPNTFLPDDQGYTPPPYDPRPKVQPSRITDFDAISDTWTTDTGTPKRYALLGADLLVLNKSAPVGSVITVFVTYAAAPARLVGDDDVPAIPQTDHQVLADMSTVFMRMKEGGQEMAKTQALLKNFIDTATRRANQVRSRSIAQQYDKVPFEIQRFDWSRILGRRRDLPPGRKLDPWPTSQQM